MEYIPTRRTAKNLRSIVNLNPEIKAFDNAHIVDTLCAFYKIAISSDFINKKELAIAMPSLMPDGWQVMLFVEEIAKGYLRISDQGKLVTWLEQNGINTKSEINREIINERLRLFGMNIDNSVIYKDVHIPFDSNILQLAAEAISSISHLIYRQEHRTARTSRARHTILSFIEKNRIQSSENYSFNIDNYNVPIDFYLEKRKGKSPIAIQTVDALSQFRDRFEMKYYRLARVKQKKADLRTLLVHSGDVSILPEGLLDSARYELDLVCSYNDSSGIKSMLV